MKLLGLLGGMSWTSTISYYRRLNQLVTERLGGLHSARLLLYSVDFETVERLQHAGRWDEAGELLADAARRLVAGGAEGIVLCTNTMHKVAESIESAVEVPLLHIADPTGEAIKAAGCCRVGLLGTRFTMEQPFYRQRLAERFGLEVLVPGEADREMVHRVIFDELCAERIESDSRRAYQRVIADLAEQGAEAVILGCTEIALLIGEDDVALPVFDTTELHVRAAVDFALGEHEPPQT
ncbi:MULTISPECIES: aspartate/glutamate racemase family protein [unclassified Wenzhouxiangella]|uniref:aspartate/glutamate racemase family protein n=1 Tax=unclassified Wenzhouxiangella TaxID=2613841 RepID=UPI000E329C5F|nr:MULTISPECIES: aspartate/glutamate racemase family protein [unclassified Wenzhouxiangella]RFF27443.1 aspartate/glutamate racemase family protein [Wenzhouxiangella sp. 15181]RFP68871.1 aspartate/glutamate racemase family protein [Wenzhouxiangella sp. 15190]